MREPSSRASNFGARPKATPALPGFVVPAHYRVRRDKVDITGVITLRHNSRLHHIGLGRRLRTPAEAFGARPKAAPALPGITVPPHCRVRRDKVDITGVITLRHNSRLHHIGLGRKLIGTRVIALVAGLDVRVLTEDGQLLRALTLDPSRDYQPHGRA